MAFLQLLHSCYMCLLWYQQTCLVLDIGLSIEQVYSFIQLYIYIYVLDSLVLFIEEESMFNGQWA